MPLFDIFAILVCLAAVFSYVNHRLLKLPPTIGLMLLSIALSLGLVLVGRIWPPALDWAEHAVAGIDFTETLMHGMLGYLLFAGALHVNLNDLAQQKLIIIALASVGVLISTFVIGAAAYALLGLMGFDVPLILCLVFGALISPTDPIAVMGILKTLGAPQPLATKIAGESLFNDGIGVVVFLVLMGIAGLGGHHGEVTVLSVIHNLLWETGGGVIHGLIIGYIAYRMLKSLDHYQTEILISLALVTGGYALAYNLNLSGPIAMVIAGLMIGNHGRALAMSDTTRANLDTFWELIDEMLNAVLFVLIGLEVLILTFNARFFLAGLLVIPITLAARFIAVGLPIRVLKPWRVFTPHSTKVLTWGGLRGGISVALALTLREQLAIEQAPVGNLLLVMTYVVVIFSIVVQGLTIAPLMSRLGLGDSNANSLESSTHHDHHAQK